MKRNEIQKKIAATAKTLASKIENGTLKATVPTGGYPIASGEPGNAVGQVLKSSGFAPKDEYVTSNDEAVAKALGTTTDALPANVSAAAQILGGTRNNRSLVKNLREFADAISTAKVRKPYTKSGLYTQAAKDAGTFGVSAAV